MVIADKTFYKRGDPGINEGKKAHLIPQTLSFLQHHCREAYKRMSRIRKKETKGHERQCQRKILLAVIR